jgi:hypothetical protein
VTNQRTHSVSDGRIGSRKGSANRDSKRLKSPRRGKIQEGTNLEPVLAEPKSIHDSANVLKSRNSKTDNLIDCLHRSLMQQLDAKPSERRGSVLDGTLSGAVAHKIGERRDIAHERVRTTVREKKKRECAQIAQLLAKSEELVTLAQDLGIDMAATVKNISHAKAALGREEVAVARDWTGSADWRVRDELSIKCPPVVRGISASLRQLENECGAETNLRQIINESKLALRAEDYQKALRLLNDAKRSIKNAQNEVVLRILLEGKSDFVKAKGAGLNIDESVDLLNMSKDKLMRGEFSESVRFARESRKVIEKALDNQREAKNPLAECIKAIRLAETLGADVQGLNDLLVEAKRLYRHNDMVRSADRSRKLLDLARRTAYDKAAESYQLAEKSLALAKKTAVMAPEAEEKLFKARVHLEKNEFAQSVSLSCASIFESDSAIVNAMADRVKGFDDFAKGIEQDVESLTEVQEGIASSKLRNLENLKKYADQTESIIGEAYECAAAYARVAQDIVKQAYECSIEAGQIVDRDADGLGQSPEISSVERRPFSEKRQRLANLFLTGKVTESQLDKLLLMIESSVEKDNLV